MVISYPMDQSTSPSTQYCPTNPITNTPQSTNSITDLSLSLFHCNMPTNWLIDCSWCHWLQFHCMRICIEQSPLIPATVVIHIACVCVQPITNTTALYQLLETLVSENPAGVDGASNPATVVTAASSIGAQQLQPGVSLLPKVGRGAIRLRVCSDTGWPNQRSSVSIWWWWIYPASNFMLRERDKRIDLRKKQ